MSVLPAAKLTTSLRIEVAIRETSYPANESRFLAAMDRRSGHFVAAAIQGKARAFRLSAAK